MARSDVICGGYVGKILRVDLTKGSLRDEMLDPEVLRKYVGGLGLAAKIMYDEVSPNVKLFDPENRVIFMTGPFTGTAAPGSSRYTVFTLNSFNPKFCSPGYGGGFWAVELKRSGYDGIILQGQSPKPVFLWIHDDKAEIRDASTLWGKDTHETEDQVKELLGVKASVATIGPAGENLVRGSVISNDKRHIAAKAGDVLGSKRLKAIAVGGGKRKPVSVADSERAKQIASQWRERGSSKRRINAGNLRNWGRPEFFGEKSPWILWVKNLSDPEFAYEYGKGVWGVSETSKVNPIRCYNCTVGCAYDCEIGRGPYKGKVVTLTGGAENYEGFAGNIGVSDGETILYLTDLLDRFGVDARVGQSIAMLYECYEKGILNREHTDGLELKWGNTDAAIELLKKIVKRDGIGAILEKGPKEAAQILSEKTGKDLTPFNTSIKGCPPISHDYRWSWQKMLAQAVCSFGPVSQGGNLDFSSEPDLGFDKPGKLFDNISAPILVAKSMIKKVFEDCLGICWFMASAVPGVMVLESQMLSAIVGRDFGREDAELLGERVINLGRMFNLRRGLKAEDDLDVSPRLLEDPPAGIGKGHSIKPHLKQMVEDYYTAMGWDKTSGRPTKSTLERLGLGELAK
jgi:aldehyde:ferredoxin oxidoreductase